MGYKRTPFEKSIMAAFHVHGHSAEATAEATGIPLDIVLRTVEANRILEDADGPHSMAQKLSSPYGSYWRQWQEAHPEKQAAAATPAAPAVKKSSLPKPKPQGKGRTVRPRRQVRMVPDDRSDEFGFMLDAITGGVIKDSQKDEGQGVA